MAEETRRRRSIRLSGFDYSQPGAYFVTLCTQGRACILSEIVQGVVNHTPTGQVASKVWLDLPSRFHGIALDLFVIMPNHLHGVIVLEESVGAGLAPPKSVSVGGRTGAASRAPTLSEIMRLFKSVSTIETHRLFRGVGRRLWQRGFYDRVIRGEEDLSRIRDYISGNPFRWEEDDDHPRHINPEH